MKKPFKAFMIAGLLTLGSIARPLPISQASNFSSSPAPSLEGGAILYAELSKSLDAKKAKVGDPVVAVLLADVLSHGKIVAHRDSKLIGHITEVKPFAKEDSESRLGIVFEKIRFKSGEEVPFNSVLMALHPAHPPTLDLFAEPTQPGGSLGGTLGHDRHSPMAAGSPKRPSSTNTRRLGTNQDTELEAAARAKGASGTTNIDGLRLISTGGRGPQTVVSRDHTVKLESGVLMELRVTAPAGQ